MRRASANISQPTRANQTRLPAHGCMAMTAFGFMIAGRGWLACLWRLFIGWLAPLALRRAPLKGCILSNDRPRRGRTLGNIPLSDCQLVGAGQIALSS